QGKLGFLSQVTAPTGVFVLIYTAVMKQRGHQTVVKLQMHHTRTATLSCHFKVESLKYGVQWFKSEQQLISNSSRQIVVAKNQTSSLVITNTTIQDSGWYYCEVNVLKKDPEWGNGTKLVVLGKKQIAGFRNEHAHNLLGPLRPGDVAMLVIMSHLYLFILVFLLLHIVLLEPEGTIFGRRSGMCIHRLYAGRQRNLVISTTPQTQLRGPAQ
uniref:Ig-like domain-containing protein n=1 Tax=Pundamilia nyererei TaxID=303518 RepID=A0A3B4G0E3_9CICH